MQEAQTPPQSNDPQPPQMTGTKTKTKTRLKTAVIAGAIGLFALAGVSGGANYLYGTLVTLNYDASAVMGSATAGAVNHNIYGFSAKLSPEFYYYSAEAVNVNQIVIAFYGTNVNSGQLKEMFRNVTLFDKKTSNYYGYGYYNNNPVYLGTVSQLYTTSGNVAYAVFQMPQNLRINLNEMHNFILRVDVPAQAPSGNFYVRVASVTGWGYSSGKAVRLANYSQGPVLTINAAANFSADIKVNNSDNPSAVPYGGVFTASWTSAGASSCTGFGQDVMAVDGGVWTSGTMPANGSRALYARSSSVSGQPFSTFPLSIQCYKDVNQTISVTDTVYVPVTQNSTSISVIQPNGGETLVKGRPFEIKWTGGAPQIIDPPRSVALKLVKEDGVTQVGWIQFGNQPSGSYMWDPAKVRSAIGYPYNVNVPDGYYKVMAVDYNATQSTKPFDVSDGVFGITSQNSVKISYPNGGEQWKTGNKYAIDWLVNGLTNPLCSIDLRKFENGIVTGVKNLAANYPANVNYTTTYNWTVPGDFATGQYRVFITCKGGNSTFTYGDDSDAAFTINSNNPQVTVFAPNGGETYQIGQTVNIKWSQTNVDKVYIGYKRCDSCLDWITTNLSVDINSKEGSYSWTIPSHLTAGSTYKIEVIGYHTGYGSATDRSDANFTINSSGQQAQNKYVYSGILVGYMYPPCSCDNNVATANCANEFATTDPAGSVCYDRYQSFYRRYYSKKYVAQGSTNAALSVSTFSDNQTVIRGTNGFVLGNFSFDAKNYPEDVKVSAIEIQQKVDQAANDNAVTGLQLFDGVTALNAGANVVNPDGGGTVNNYRFSFDSPLIIAKGTQKTLALKGNISGSATVNSFQQWGLKADALVTAASVASGNAIAVRVAAADGQKTTISGGGSYSVLLDSSSPQSRLLVGGSTGNTMTVLRFRATTEPVRITKVRLNLPSVNNVANNLAAVNIYDGTTRIGSGIFIGSNPLDIVLTTPLAIPQNGEKIMTIKADLANVGANEPGVSGQVVAIYYTSSEGIGVNSGTRVTNNTFVSTQSPAYVFKSVPVVSKLTLPTTTLNNGTLPLYRFRVEANAKGDIDIFQFNFRFTRANVNLSNLTLVDVTNQEAVLYAGSGEVCTSLTCGVGIVLQAPPGIPSQTIQGTPRTVSAGQTKIFELRASVSGAVSGSSVSTYLLGDTNHRPSMPAAQFITVFDHNFIWSDRSASGHNLSTPDWTNGFLIPGLPAAGLGTEVLAR